MADPKSKSGGPDRNRINDHEEYGPRDWCDKFGVTPERLKEVVERGGPTVDDVRKALRG